MITNSEILKVAIALLILPGLLSITSCKSQHENEPSEKSEEWISLFNGEDLEGWTIRIVGKELGANYGNTFRVDSGMLKIRYDEYENFDNQFGAIYYNQPYSNYRLKLQYRFVGETAPGAPEWGYRDSGVQFHSQSPQSMRADQSFPVCVEYNLHGGNGVDERPTGEVCTPGTYVKIAGIRNSSFCTVPDLKRTFHGNQWVSLEIEVRDSLITHFANGEKILTYEDPRYDPGHEDGKGLIVNGNDRVTSGYISLQSNSHPIDFKEIQIMEFKE